MQMRQLNLKAVVIGLLIVLSPNLAWASNLDTLDSVQNVLSRENQNVTVMDFIKIMLERDGFNERISVPEDQLFTDVDVEDAHLVEKMRQLGVVSRNFYNPVVNADRELNLWSTLDLLFKYEGTPVKRFLIDPANFEEQVSNIKGDSYLAPVFDKALELDLIEPTNKRVFFLSKVSVNKFMSILDKLEDSSNRTTIRVVPQSALQKESKYAILEDVFDRIKNNYLENRSVNDDKLLYGAIEGLVDALGDPFSSFQKPQEYSDFRKNLSQEFEGIGASLYVNDNGDLQIISPISNSPAEAAGLLPADIITKANGIKLRGLTIEESIDIIKGPAGTTVRLEIERDGKTLNFNIVRAKIDIPLVLAEIHSNNIGYLKIRSFGPGVTSIFESLYETISSDANNLIIDLRSNPGGYLNEAINLAELFLDANKPIVNVKYNNITETKTTKTPASIKPRKIAVLINKGSASASEILAAALKENLSNVVVIGETSFGKGTVQELINYRDNSALKLTIAEWLSPTLKKINKFGIAPDITVVTKLSDMQSDNDAVLNRALIELR